MIVTIIGGTADLARELARTFAANGFEIRLVARKSERLQPLQQDLTLKHGVAVSLHELDLLDFERYESVLQPLAETTDVVIFVAGYYAEQRLAETELPKIIQLLDVNYKAGVLSLHWFKQVFERKNKGTIIGISSVAGERGRAKNYFYGSAKAGFTAYLSGLRNQLNAANVAVLTVLPGFMATKMTDGMPLPAPITASPKVAAEQIFRAFQRKKNVVYVLPVWRWIMLIIRNIPENVFKKLNI